MNEHEDKGLYGVSMVTDHEPTLTDVVRVLSNLYGTILRIRKVRGVRLTDGRELIDPDVGHGHEFILYDAGVQMENDNGATLFAWDEIAEVLV